jgi:hypothetical protein
MRHWNGRDRCIVCSADVDLPVGPQVRTMIIGTAGTANVRVVSVNGKEIHRCAMGQPLPPAGSAIDGVSASLASRSGRRLPQRVWRN